MVFKSRFIQIYDLRRELTSVSDMGQNRSKRVFELDFARCICALIIIAFHYACHTENEKKLLFTLPYGRSYGDLAVTVFFILSGAALYCAYPNIKSIKQFLFKRWKSIFPMFYLCYLYYYLQNVFHYHSFFGDQIPKH